MNDAKPQSKITNPDIALLKIQKWCAYQERCQQEVRDKLYEYGLWADAVEELISKLISDKFIDEERFAKTYVRGKFNIKKWGRVKIKQHLKQKRISDYSIKKAMMEIDGDNYYKTLKKVLVQKRKTTNESNPIKLKFKLATYAMSRGFEQDLIFDALKEIESGDN
jgi:regulatory protein